MKKTEWPIRWDLLVRYRLIEAVALWEGRLTTNHICYSFGIGRQQASKDINTYLRELAPGNLEYDRHLKGYVPASNFKPVVTRGEISEYQDLVASQLRISQPPGGCSQRIGTAYNGLRRQSMARSCLV
jgi:hypothetical protein